jgi:N-acyl-D-amino-acid deacylase
MRPFRRPAREDVAMTYDLVIRGGTVVDGSDLPRYRGDVAVAGGRIARIGRIRERGREEIDARDAVVAPGFIDGHTHMDAQVAWDPLGTCSCWHGVTTVVMGNCGFTLAPCRPDERHLVLRNLERAEDIPAEAMRAGIEWSWESYGQYLDAVERWPKGINYAGYVGHSALRTYAMGERAFSEPATAGDLAAMKRELADALGAGAMGFTTSRTRNHETADRKPVASRIASWDEVRELVGVMGDLGAGIFEIAGEDTGRDPDRIRDYLGRLRALAVETGVPVTWGMFSMRAAPGFWRPYFELLDDTAQAGGRMFAQVHSRALSVLLSFETRLPFDRLSAGAKCGACPSTSSGRCCGARSSGRSSWRRLATRSTRAGSAPRPGAPTSSGSSSWRIPPGPIARWRSWRGSAASTRWRPCSSWRSSGTSARSSRSPSPTRTSTTCSR